MSTVRTVIELTQFVNIVQEEYVINDTLYFRASEQVTHSTFFHVKDFLTPPVKLVKVQTFASIKHFVDFQNISK